VDLPVTLTNIPNFTMQTYLLAGAPGNIPPHSNNILTKNFAIVDYAYKGVSGVSSTQLGNENEIGTGSGIFGYSTYLGTPFSGTEISPENIAPIN
jgi:hypothetical protein